MDLLDTVCDLTGARTARRGRRIQSLWRGYGEVTVVHLTDGPVERVVVKHVRPPVGAHPRKLRSYAVEAAWYAHPWPDGPERRRPRFYGTRTEGHERVLVLEDLHAAGFVRTLSGGDTAQLDAALAWLAQLHAAFVEAPAPDIWPVGTYWHLETRRAELAATPDPRWHAEAPRLDAALRGARFQTVVHGDAKPANFLWSPTACDVAAVDFQYVGGGPGTRDVVYLLGTDDPRDPRLQVYFDVLRAVLPQTVDAEALEAEWRSLVPVAAQDFARFMAGWGRV